MTYTSNTAVTWQASEGTISSSGLFTAPSVTSSSKVTVTATSVADRSVVATSQVTVVPLTKLLFATASLPSGTAGTPYSTTLTATGGITPYVWQITGGSLPQGLTLDKSSGVISGITSHDRNVHFHRVGYGRKLQPSQRRARLSMSSSTTGKFDGPAELPRVYVASDYVRHSCPGQRDLRGERWRLPAGIEQCQMWRHDRPSGRRSFHGKLHSVPPRIVMTLTGLLSEPARLTAACPRRVRGLLRATPAFRLFPDARLSTAAPPPTSLRNFSFREREAGPLSWRMARTTTGSSAWRSPALPGTGRRLQPRLSPEGR